MMNETNLIHHDADICIIGAGVAGAGERARRVRARGERRAVVHGRGALVDVHAARAGGEAVPDVAVRAVALDVTVGHARVVAGGQAHDAGRGDLGALVGQHARGAVERVVHRAGARVAG